MHEFSNPTCDADSWFGNKSAIDFDGNTIITQGKKYCSDSGTTQTQAIGDILVFSIMEVPGSKWNQNNIYLIWGPVNNPILGGASLLLSDTGTRFAKEFACTLLIQYDYNQRYADVYNWNEVQEEEENPL